MPPKVSYKIYPILVKTNKLTILLEASPTRTISSIKEEVLSALTSKVGKDEDEVPEVDDVDEFELCRELKERGRQPTGKYEALKGEDAVKNVGQAWEVLYIRFKQSGKLMPVEVTLPSILQPDEDEVYAPEPSSSKGKRKAPAEFQ